MEINNAKRMKYNEDNNNDNYSDGFKEWYNKIVVPRNNGTLNSLMVNYDGIQEQYLLHPDDPRSHIYQYKEYCNNNKIKSN